MSDQFEQPVQQTTEKQRTAIIKGLDKMVKKGQMTEAEANSIRDADTTEAFDQAIRSVRVRHAKERFKAEVADGSMAQADADALLEQIRGGAHPRGLRSHLRYRASNNGSQTEP